MARRKNKAVDSEPVAKVNDETHDLAPPVATEEDIIFVRPHRHSGQDYVPGDKLTVSVYWADYLRRLGAAE